MVKLTGTFSQLSSQCILVIGDFILDRYTIGKVRRISPEAPVPVLSVQRQEHRPGGAGNVVLNLVSMGAQVRAVGRIGEDEAGQILKEALESEGVETKGLFVQEDYHTPLKERVIADAQQIVRLDYEKVVPTTAALEKEILDIIPDLLEGVKVVSISDYGKGLLSPTLLQALIRAARAHEIPVIVDPKGSDFSRYAGATLVKPNLGETYAAADLAFDADLQEAANRILSRVSIDTLMVTRSEEGISLFHRDGGRQDFPVSIREVRDVTGAGDTVLAVITLALASGLHLDLATQLSNVAAGMAVERFGCARITLSELARRLLEEDSSQKVFDEEHLYALRAALRSHPFIVLSCSLADGWTPELFNAIRTLSQPKEHDLVLHVRGVGVEHEMLSLLASLKEVDFILVGEHLAALCQALQPKAIWNFEKQSLQSLKSLEELPI